jgi:quercetin dioxygenase-like cupin family protein
VVIIPPHAVHSGKAMAKSRVIDVFYPIREDYR